MSDFLEWEKSLNEKQTTIEKRIGTLNEIHSTLGPNSNLIEFGYENSRNSIRQQIDEIQRKNTELNEYADRIENEIDESFKILEIKINKLVNYLRYFQNLLTNGTKIHLANSRERLMEEIARCRENIRTFQSNQNVCGEFEFDRILEKSAAYLEIFALQLDESRQRVQTDQESLSLTNFLKSLERFNREFTKENRTDAESDCGGDSRNVLDLKSVTRKFQRCLDKLNDPSLYPMPLKLSSAYYNLTQNDKENFNGCESRAKQVSNPDSVDYLLAKIESFKLSK